MGKVLMIDPPGGWEFGFPRPLPEKYKDNILGFLVGHGYPQEKIWEYGEHFYYRCWEVDEEELKEVYEGKDNEPT